MYKVCKNIETETREMREVFADTMMKLAENDKKVIYLDGDIMNSIKMVPFSKKFPEQTIDCGIQEANMVGVAAGMSSVGLIPYAHTFAPFITRRAMDQVFMSCAYAKLNVRLIGSDPGMTATSNGGTHFALEDIGTLRSIPNVTIIDPSDSTMLKDCLIKTKDLYGVYYMRLSRKKVDKIYEDGSTFEIGKANLVRDGSDITIIANGFAVGDAIRVSDDLKKEGISVRVLDMFTIKPIDKEAIIKAAKETKAIITVENHNIIGGLGSAVSEVLCENCPCILKRLGAKDRFGEVGDLAYLKKTFGVSYDDIKEAVLEMKSSL